MIWVFYDRPSPRFIIGMHQMAEMNACWVSPHYVRGTNRPNDMPDEHRTLITQEESVDVSVDPDDDDDVVPCDE